MRSRKFRRIPALLTLVLAMAVDLCAQSLQVTHADGTSATLTAAQITALPHLTVNAKDHDTPAQFEGVPLSAVLALAGVQLGNSMRGPRLAEALLVEAADGYKVVFALAEIDPDSPTARSFWPTNATASRSMRSRDPGELLHRAISARRAGSARSPLSRLSL